MRPVVCLVIKSSFYLLEAAIGPGVGFLLIFFGMTVWPSIDLFEGMLLAILILYSSTILGICIVGQIYAKLFLSQYNMAGGIVSCILGSFVGVLVTFPAVEIFSDYGSGWGPLELIPMTFPTLIGAVIGFNVGLIEVNK